LQVVAGSCGKLQTIKAGELLIWFIPLQLSATLQLPATFRRSFPPRPCIFHRFHSKFAKRSFSSFVSRPWSKGQDNKKYLQQKLI